MLSAAYILLLIEFLFRLMQSSSALTTDRILSAMWAPLRKVRPLSRHYIFLSDNILCKKWLTSHQWRQIIHWSFSNYHSCYSWVCLTTVCKSNCIHLAIRIITEVHYITLVSIDTLIQSDLSKTLKRDCSRSKEMYLYCTSVFVLWEMHFLFSYSKYSVSEVLAQMLNSSNLAVVTIEY